MLQKINLDLRAGEILGVGGLAGQGQSELFRCLFGLMPYQGEIEIKGRVVKLNSTTKAMAEKIAPYSGRKRNTGTYS